MNAKALNPGSIHVRVGKVLEIYEAAVAAKDWETADAMVSILGTYLAVYLTAKQLATFMAMPTWDWDDRTNQQAFRDINARMMFLLIAAKEHNVFSKREIDMGDSSALDEEEGVTA